MIIEWYNAEWLIGLTSQTLTPQLGPHGPLAWANLTDFNVFMKKIQQIQ